MERFLSIPSDFWKSFTNVTAIGPVDRSEVISNPNTGTPHGGKFRIKFLSGLISFNDNKLKRDFFTIG